MIMKSTIYNFISNFIIFIIIDSINIYNTFI